MQSSSDVSQDTPQLAQDGAWPGGSRLPPAPQLVMVPSQGAGPLAIEIQPSRPQATPPVQQAQAAPTAQQAQAAPNVRQSPVAPAIQQGRAAPPVQPPPAAPNVRQSQIVPEVRQSRAASNAQLAWIASDVRPSHVSPDVDQSLLEYPDPQADPIKSVTVHDISPGSGRAFTKLLATAAVACCGLVGAWALASVLFPNAPKDEVSNQSPSMVAPAPEDVSAQREQTPSDDSQSAEVSTPATQVGQATSYVVANAGPTAQSQPQNDQQQPQSQALNEQQQPQPQQRPNEQQTTSPQQVGNEQAEPPRPLQNSVPTLSSEEVDRLTNLGEKMLAQGDLATARRVLEHAAQARGARAALLLGATYDPEGQRKMGVVGMRPDLEKAHMWYVRAAEFGSSEASRRLAGLGQRSH
jgi:hypothetical protein